MTENDVMTQKSCESCTFTMVSTESEPCYSCRGMRNYTKDINSEHESLRELNRELVEGLEYCVKNVPEFSDIPGIASVLAKARGAK